MAYKCGLNAGEGCVDKNLCRSRCPSAKCTSSTYLSSRILPNQQNHGRRIEFTVLDLSIGRQTEIEMQMVSFFGFDDMVVVQRFQLLYDVFVGSIVVRVEVVATKGPSRGDGFHFSGTVLEIG